MERCRLYDRVLDAFARVFEIQETTAVAVARNEDNYLLLAYNIHSIFFNDNKELQSTKILISLVEEEVEENNNVTSCKERTDQRIGCIHNILKDLYELNPNNKEYSNQFNKNLLKY